MKLSYFEDTDTLYIEFRAGDIAESKDLDENTRLSEHPELGKRLTGLLSDRWSYQVGDWRILAKSEKRKW